MEQQDLCKLSNKFQNLEEIPIHLRMTHTPV